MKKRIGNDISFVWHIYRKDGETQVPESFADKNVEVKLISPLQRTVTIEDMSITTGVVTFTFRGKHQVTLGNYVAVLLENKGEDGMVTLDVVDAVTLVPHSYMEEDGDEGDVIEATSVELESTISAGGGGGFVQQQADWAQTDDTAVDFIQNKPNLDVYCRKDMANVHTGGYDQYIKDFGESVGNVAIDAQQLWVRLLYPNGELVSETRVGPGNIRIAKNGVTLNLNPAYFQTLVEAINGIEVVIPEQASSSNKLADKDFVNSSIATATATYRGSYNLVSDLLLSVSATQQQIATALATKMEALSIMPDNNDYCFVQIPTADATPTEIARIDRYKYDGTAWAYEYSLNNSSFTAAQWEAINSSITSGLVTKLSDLPTATELATLLAGKANKSEMSVVPGTGANADKTTITLKQGTSATVLTAHQDISGKENMMPITTATGATLSAVVGNYYRLDNVGTLAITLPTIVGATKLQAITFLLVCGSSALVTFAPQGSETILYQEDFALEADTTYEVTALWNGSEWTLSRVVYE